MPQKTNLPRLLVHRLRPQAQLPARAHLTDVGLDLYAYCLNEQGVSRSIIIGQKASRRIPTGLAIAPPDGYAAYVCSRSGLAGSGIFVANAPGVIDPGYRGELEVILYNGSNESHYVRHGDRVAQLILLPICLMAPNEVDVLPLGERGEAGFGSTGR